MILKTGRKETLILLDNFGYLHCSETLAMYLDEHKKVKIKWCIILCIHLLSRCYLKHRLLKKE